MLTRVYIDGFNFYYACWKSPHDPACAQLLASGPYKWVDVLALSQMLVPNDIVDRVYYCTAPVKGSQAQRQRQDVYIRALRTIPTIDVLEGHHEERVKIGRLATPLPCRQATACASPNALYKVVTREEKGSDVNLATYLLRDAFLKKFEHAVVISNDSDLTSAIRVVRVDAKLTITVVSPGTFVVPQLGRAATNAQVLDKSLLPRCQLPPMITTKKGARLTKPPGW